MLLVGFCVRQQYRVVVNFVRISLAVTKVTTGLSAPALHRSGAERRVRCRFKQKKSAAQPAFARKVVIVQPLEKVDVQKSAYRLNIVSLNCMPDARNAYLDMKQVYEYYSGRKFNEPMPKSGYAKVKLIHYIQSFDPKDNISIETAQKIGLDLVREMFGEDVQAVIATHDDTGKVHNHIMLNVYDLKGRHFSSDKASLNKKKKLSDEICKRYGIKPFDRKNYVRKPMSKHTKLIDELNKEKEKAENNSGEVSSASEGDDAPAEAAE